MQAPGPPRSTTSTPSIPSISSILILGFSLLLSSCAGARTKETSPGFTPTTTLELVAVFDAASLRRGSLSGADAGAEPFLSAPASIALTNASHSSAMIIADRQSGRVLQISEAGALINDVVPSGSGTNYSPRPARVIRMDPGGTLYVCDGVSGRAWTYDPQWRRGADLVPPYDALGIVEGSITGLALGAFGEIYLTDGTNGRVYRFDASGRYVSSFRGEENEWARLFRPAGAACAAWDGSLFVCDPSQGHVVVFDNAGLPRRSFGEGELKEPVAVALDSRGQAYVADTRTKTIGVFDSSGRLVGQIDSNNLPTAALQGPTDIAIADSLLYIADPPSGRVLKILMRDAGR